MDKRVTGIVGYITPIGWIIAFCAGDRGGARFYLNQALVLWIFSLGTYVLALFPFGNILNFVYSALLLIGWVIGIMHAISEEEKEIPVIGQIRILK